MMKKILVIDDAEFILESTSTLLGFEGYEIATASDGIVGYQMALEAKPDLILCDISMPGLDGYGVLERIRSNNETRTLPFIFLTAFTDKTNMRTGMEKGADDYLIKPFTRDELVSAIEAQWKKSSIVQQHLQQKVEEVSKSISSALPHEFRTVLNQISGSARFLNSNSSNVTSEDIKELSQDILHSTQRLLKITENYLIYARIESISGNNNKRALLRSFHTDEPIAMLIDISKNIALKFERANDLHIDADLTDLFIEMSTESFHKVVDELVDNAFKFSKHGQKVNISANLNNNYIEFKITDYGRGMSTDQINSIGAYVQFERQIYEQQGVGLGLMIAKKIIEIHDGTFIINSKDDKGTTVYFTIPAGLMSGPNSQ